MSALATDAPPESLLSVQGLQVGVPRDDGSATTLVHDVSFDITPGERYGLVGESGSGKSMTLRAIAGLLPRGVEVLGGRIEFGGSDLLTMPPGRRRLLMGPKISMIFQEPMTALNPTMRVGKQVAEGPRRHFGPVEGRGRPARRGDDRAHRHPRPSTQGSGLPARALGRSPAAHHDRDGAVVQARRRAV